MLGSWILEKVGGKIEVELERKWVGREGVKESGRKIEWGLDPTAVFPF